MPTPIDWPRWTEIKTAFDAVLAGGFAPPRVGGGKGSSVGEVAKRLSADESTIAGWIRTQERRKSRGQDHALPDWSLFRQAPKAHRTTVESRVARRWLLTAAQDDTRVHGPFWANLKAFAAYLGAEIVVAPFTYNKKLFTDHETRSGAFAEEVRPFLRYDSMDCGKVVFCAEMNTLPTANRPLSGLHSYTRGRSGVFPHAKVALESVPSMPGVPAPIIMTTGACTVENYIAKKAGLKAAFHHVIGATLVEEDSDGRTFCRQINATDDGSFQDLTHAVRDGVVSAGHRVEAITWGDIHRRKLNHEVAIASWGFDTEASAITSSNSMLDVLRPRYQFFHDLLDFETRNHHEDGNALVRFDLHVKKRECIAGEVAEAARFLRATERDWCRSVVVESNHDLFLQKWLNKSDYRVDPVNAMFFLRMQLASYEARERGDADFSVFRYAMKLADPQRLLNIEFSPENGSYVISREHGGIECGSHGHLGPNGARGSAASLLKMAMKMNRGHEHSCSIYDGVYTAGVSGNLDMTYNRGPGSWSHSHVAVYGNGKRSIITLADGRWRA